MSEKESKQIEETFAELETQIEKKVTSELEPFLDGIRAMLVSSRELQLLKKEYIYFKEKYAHARRIFNYLLTPKVLKAESVVVNTYMLFVYLGAVESLGNSIADILVMLLVANGKDFHIECLYTRRTPRIRHAVSIKDLEDERVPLGTKLSFLEDNGLKELASIIDSKLRNAIAHLKFDVKEDGIYVLGKYAEPITLIGLKRLFAGVSKAEMLLSQLAMEKGWIPKGEDNNE